jgi:hypothetical protein
VAANMAGDSTGSPLETVAGTDTERATDAFATLSNETRLAILLALWDAHDSIHPEEGVSFSALRDRVGVRDSGQFNYHLEQLVGGFVRKVDDGYILRRAGQKLVRTVIAGAGIEEPTLERTLIDVDCPYCGGQTAVLYEDEWLYHVCTECEGGYAGTDEQPDGYLTGAALDPAGFADRSPEELWAAALNRAHQDMNTMLEGVCNECSAPVRLRLKICEEHDDEGVCSTCGRTPAAIVILACSVCKNYHVTSPQTVVMHHPAVIAFYHDHGVDIGYSRGDVAQLRQRERLVTRNDQTVVSADPPEVEVTVRYGDDSFRLALDETAAVTVGGSERG